MNMNRIGIIKFLRCVRQWTKLDVFSQKVRPFLAVFGRRRGFWTQKNVLGFDRGGRRPRLWIQNATLSWVKMAHRPSLAKKLDYKIPLMIIHRTKYEV